MNNPLYFINGNDDDDEVTKRYSPAANRRMTNSPWDYPGESFTHTTSGTQERCFHQWATYVGFTETYQYCTLCNKKKS